MDMRNRVGITGLGIMAANGIGLTDFWDTLERGESGIGPITCFDPEGMKCQIAGEVSDFDPEYWIPPEFKPRRMSRGSQFAVTAARLAIEDAGLTTEVLEKCEPIPCILGVCSSALDILAKNPTVSTAGASLPNSAVTAVGQMYHFQTRNITLSNACSSGLDAICLGMNLVKRGEADIVLAGGADASLTRYCLESLLKCKRCCTLNDEPSRASRPFDRARDRGVLAEGAGIVVIENWVHALARGVRPAAEVVSYGSCVDHKDEEEGLGLRRTMEMAMSNAGLRPKDIDCIFAHGPSDTEMDAAETRAIKKAFGDDAYKIPVTSIKGVTGCSMGAGGAHQVIAGALSMTHSLIPPTANFEHGDEECDLDYVPGRARRASIQHTLINAHGIGQSNTSLILRAS